MRQQDTVREDAAKMAAIVRDRLSGIVPAASMEVFGSQCMETGDFYFNLRIRIALNAIAYGFKRGTEAAAGGTT